MNELPTAMQRVALNTLTSLCAGCLAACLCLGPVFSARADDSAQAHAEQTNKIKPNKAKAKSVKKAADNTAPPSAAVASSQAPAAPQQAPAPQPEAAQVDPVCKLNEPEQPRGGRVDVLGDRFGSAPVVRIAGKPARILIRKQDRISVQVPADSNGGEITLLNDGKVASCGTLVIIGKNR